MFDETWTVSALTSIQVTRKQTLGRLPGLKSQSSAEFQRAINGLKKACEFDLGKYASGETSDLSEYEQAIDDFYRGLAMTLLEGTEPKERQPMLEMYQALLADQHESRGTTSSSLTPVEFENANWLSMLRSWWPNPVTHEVAPDLAVLAGHVACSSAGPNQDPSSEVLGLLTFVGSQFDQDSSQELLEGLNQAVIDDALLLECLADPERLEPFWEAGGTRAMRNLVGVAAGLHRGAEPGDAGRVFQHILKSELALPQQAALLVGLADISRNERLAPELVEGIVSDNRLNVAHLIVRCGVDSSSGRQLSLDAQVVLKALIDKYHSAKSQPHLIALGHRIYRLGLVTAHRDRLVKHLTSKAEFATKFVSGKLNVTSLLKSCDSASRTEDRLFYLSLIAIQNHDGETLGSITRGLACLILLKENRKIDDHHFRRIVDAITTDLPDSLSILDAVPDSAAEDLRRLIVPLQIAAELYHREPVMDYLSDTYLQLKMHDKKQA